MDVPLIILDILSLLSWSKIGFIARHMMGVAKTVWQCLVCQLAKEKKEFTQHHQFLMDLGKI